MILITGGAYQGKLEFAKKLYEERNDKKQEEKRPVIAEGETADLKELQRADIISHFHLWLRGLLIEKENPYPMVDKLLAENPEVLLALNQLGCGVVPMEAFDREYRETVGRIGCLLAEKAEAVYLVNCGIARRIK